MRVYIIQPPIVQCNTPYPSGAYLRSFFLRCAEQFPGRITSVAWHDLNIALFHAVFSHDGIAKLFELSSDEALLQAERAAACGDRHTAFNLRRYVSQSSAWTAWISTITALLCGKAQERRHEFVRSAHVPRGSRMETYLAALGRDVSADDARLLASFALADIADYITAVFDGSFSLVRYAESLCTESASFDSVVRRLDAPVLSVYYEPILESLFSSIAAELAGGSGIEALCCISVPFAGAFVPALAAARACKRRFGGRVCCVLGGGYVNTELRGMADLEFFSFADVLSYDRGYGSYYALFEAGLGTAEAADAETLCALIARRGGYRLRTKHGGSADGFFCGTEHGISAEYKKRLLAREAEATACTVPDYGGIDFTQYPRLADDENPMHRLWSDGSWLKAYLAHGCYWRQCAFCDVTLDYVRSYRMTNVRALYDGLCAQAKRTGVYGIHFVDEAAPPAALARFAQYSAQDGAPFSFWGNIRFEKTFTRDLTDFLAFAGLCGVSGGIEIAAQQGLACVCKGTDMEHIVGACAAFKESGVLVHAYMIYGYWQETPELLADSMETLRQLFAAGLLDSAFWHKFTLTRHSRVYAEWQAGGHPDLAPAEPSAREGCGLRPFAENTLSFAGERASERYAGGLEAALAAWLHGRGLHKPVSSWFSFPFPRPRVARDYIETLLAAYEKRRDGAFTEPYSERYVYVWIGGKPFAAGRNRIGWMYMGEMRYCTAFHAAETAAALWELRPRAGADSIALSLRYAPALDERVFLSVRGCGLCRLKRSFMR